MQEQAQQSGQETAREKKGCPYCGSHNVSRSHRRGIVDKLFSLVYVRPYRCFECDGRYYKLAHLHTRRETTTPKAA